MKKILFFICSVSFYCSGQSITLSPGNPSFPFTIKSSGTTTGYYGDISTSATSGFQDFYVSGTSGSLGTNIGNIFGSASRFGINSVTSLILRTTGADRMTILNNGNVGVGTSTPASRFEINQTGADTDLRISSDCGFCSTRLSFISDKASTAWRPGYIASGDNGTYTGSLNFYTNGTGGANTFGNVLGMTLTNKRLSIGGVFTNTSPYVLEIHPSSSAFGTALYNASGDTYWEHYVPNGLNSNMSFYTNSSFKGSFSNLNGVYTSASDKTLKNNIAAMGSILDKVLQLQPSTYRFNDNNPTNQTSIGFIAQDVEALFPEFVYKNISKDGTEIRSMDYAGMSVIALKAIQEQQVMIKELQAEIAKLKR